MRRISLALALVGAVAATGCGGAAKKSDSGAAPGIQEGTFKVYVQNGQDQTRNEDTGVLPLEMLGGYVTSSPAGIDCGVGRPGPCQFDFAIGTTVTLTATPIAPKLFLQWSGDCIGLTCQLSGNADRYIVASFGTYAEQGAHPNWTDPAVHGPEAKKLLNAAAGALDCAECHGASLQGQGIAVSCQGCHGSAKIEFADGSPAKGETCAECHAGQGAQHQARNDSYLDANTVLTATVDSVVSTAKGTTPETYDVKLKFSLKKNGQPFSTVINNLAQKTMYATRYDGSRQFNTTFSFSAGSTAETATKGTYEVTATGKDWAPEKSDAFILVYFAETSTVLPNKGNYRYFDNLATAGKTFDDGTAWTWGSAVKSDNCSKCHPSPYLKHGYRPGPVTGLEDMVACKVCHYDTRVGSHMAWQLLATDPARYVAINGADASMTAEEKAKYGYVASTMNDTHMSHAMEFAYPQSMANCVTCHEGKLDVAFADANFTLATCKSCHPLTATNASKGAPPLYPSVGTAPAPGFKQGVMPGYHNLDANGKVSGHECNYCHTDRLDTYAAGVANYWPDGDPRNTDRQPGTGYGSPIPLLDQLHHGGYDSRVYANTAGKKLSELVTTSVGMISYDSTTKKLTVPFTVTNNDAANFAAIDVSKTVPLLAISLYGYDTKDFVVSAHGKTIDTARDLEASVGTTHPRITFTNGTIGAASATWTAEVDLSAWAGKFGTSIKRAEIGVLPKLLANPADSASPALAIGGISKTFDLVGNAVLADTAYGRNITSTAKCNACHEALAIEFHNASYGSAGVVGCRLCHTVATGGGHLEMQSRSIDSYVHSIHSMQAFDVQSIDWTDPVAELGYEHHIESTYPKFTTLDCESCHFAGTYEVPADNRSLPGVLSASSTLMAGFDPAVRTQFNVPSVVTGPGARACGSCHRSALINERDVSGLAALDQHTAAFGYRETAGTGVFDAIILKIKALVAP